MRLKILWIEVGDYILNPFGIQSFCSAPPTPDSANESLDDLEICYRLTSTDISIIKAIDDEQTNDKLFHSDIPSNKNKNYVLFLYFLI
jgi:hypothetical protein